MSDLVNLAKKNEVESLVIENPAEIDCKSKFVVLDSDNEEHHRTLEVLRRCRQVDACFIIDEHDDITLGQMEFEEPGPANWVEHVLKQDLCKIVFVGQDYWNHKINFRGSSYTGLLRNNLHRYQFELIYFVKFRKKNTLVYCDKRTFPLVIPNLRSIQRSDSVERIYILDEEVGKINNEVREQGFDVFRRDELIADTDENFPDIYPVFLIKLKDIKIRHLPVRNVYASIDLDVLMEVSEIGSVISEIGKCFNLLGADIYGDGADWLQKTGVVYEALLRNGFGLRG